ncbi:MAG: HAD-IC family P-type ATPase [Desulfuromonadaceae bacterium]|nr:HAD-IC family P-type ATPase [Desulfuromonadaceae bacterium]
MDKTDHVGADTRSPLWFTLTGEEVLERLSVDERGLTTSASEERLRRFGPNSLPAPPRRSGVIRFLLQFHNVLIYVLLGAAGMTALLSDWLDAGVIIGVVMINAAIGFVQEGKAEKAVDAIRSILTHEAIVLRDGKKTTISADKLVPGDIVFLQSGDKVPADLRLLSLRDLRVEEAALTGESIPVEKSLEQVPAEVTIGDRLNMAFSGTIVSSGLGRGVVVATGGHTELGRISALLTEVETLQTRLTRQMSEFSLWLTGAILILALGTLAFGVFVRGYSFYDMFFASVALAVAAIPEGLPAIITITLALGVQRMARRNAIIRRLPAVETLGSVNVICSDKTGTLTRNEMMVRSLVTGSRTYQISGSGYAPEGRFYHDAEEITTADDSELIEAVRAGLLCNDASLAFEDNEWKLHGDPTDGALIALALKAGQSLEACHQAWPRIDTIPFESQHKFMATLHDDPAGHRVIFLKGAPERVIAACSRQRQLGRDVPLDRSFWQQQIEQIASQGQRTLAIACLAADDKKTIDFNDVEEGLTLLGLFGLIDPPPRRGDTSGRKLPESRDSGENDNRRSCPYRTSHCLPDWVGG